MTKCTYRECEDEAVTLVYSRELNRELECCGYHAELIADENCVFWIPEAG